MIKRLQDSDFEIAAKQLDVETSLIKAFAIVESGGRSGFGPDSLPVIAFEGHWFRRLTSKRFDRSHPKLSYPYQVKAGPEWKQNNKDQRAAWKTLDTASELDAVAAVMSCSWGMFQVMGFNHGKCGFKSPLSFVNAMKAGEPGQLTAFVSFCQSVPGLVPAMKASDYRAMATLYNGKDFGDYDVRIKTNHLKLKS